MTNDITALAQGLGFFSFLSYIFPERADAPEASDSLTLHALGAVGGGTAAREIWIMLGARLRFARAVCGLRLLQGQQRSASTAERVDIKYDEYTPPGCRAGVGPLVMIHGVLGNRRNWANASRAISDETGLRSVRVDLRNHGESPHSPDCTIVSMAGDVAQLAKDKAGSGGFGMVGHSLGGKVAMHLALLDPAAITGLVIVDIPPRSGELSDFPRKALDLMLGIDSRGKAASIKELKQRISERIPRDPFLRDFILSCATLNSPKSHSNFKANIEVLRRNVHEIWEFPLASSGRTYRKPALFIMGTKSEFYSDESIRAIEKLFPQSRIELLNTGHFVQAEAPLKFNSLVSDFFNGLSEPRLGAVSNT